MDKQDLFLKLTKAWRINETMARASAVSCGVGGVFDEVRDWISDAIISLTGEDATFFMSETYHALHSKKTDAECAEELDRIRIVNEFNASCSKHNVEEIRNMVRQNGGYAVGIGYVRSEDDTDGKRR